MAMNRRDFAKALAVGAASAMLPGRLKADGLRGIIRRQENGHQETFFRWEEASGGVRVAFDQGGNVAVFTSNGEALISDAKNLGFGATLRREAESGGARLVYAVNTHHHGDHVGGNAAFTSDIPLVAHRNAPERIRASLGRVVGQENERLATAAKGLRADGNTEVAAELDAFGESLQTMSADAFVPTDAMASERELMVGGAPIELRYINSAHTDNDLFLYSRSENVLHAGDLYFNGRHPFIDVSSGATTEGWQRVVAAMIGVADDRTVVIPGHGELSNRDGLQRQSDYFGQLRDAVSEAVREGRSKEEVMALQPSDLSDIQGNPSRNLGVVYDEVAGG